MWLDKETFKCVVKNAPLISIDLIIENKNKQYLLGKRKNKPAKGFLFVPGGRILKGENISKAFERITLAEIGKSIPISIAKFLGVFEHFYKDSVFNDQISTHYIVLAYKLKISDIEISSLPRTQHMNYFWLSISEILKREDVHPYTKLYFKEKLR